MIDAQTLSLLIGAYFEEKDDAPTPSQLANFVVSRHFEYLLRHSEPDPAVLLRSALILIDKVFQECNANRITIFQESNETRLVDREGGILCRGATVSEVLLKYAAELNR